MTALQTLKRYFGYDSFRSGQEALISGILGGRDVFGIMPTGAGKSICFQVPALMMDGVTLIVSPLISLMKDQVNALTQSGVAAAYLNSSLTARQMDKAMENARRGMYKLIYVAPERLPVSDMMSLVRSVKISMLTVDEAHCISQWGQDFRPSYVQIPEFIAGLPRRPIVSAFTATATPRVRSDIVRLLGLNDPQVLVTGFDRQNLYFDVRRPKRKYNELSAFLRDKADLCGIIYCATRRTVEEVCEQLRSDGFSASRYHAGLTDPERRSNQDDFLYDRVRIMVATNAFGMGIDKSNVSFVVHYNMPKDIESYYQEAGRAGRDGSKADCVLLYSGQDVRLNQWMIENDKEGTQYPDKATEEMIRQRNRERLRQMTFYSTTGDCLRGFILKYFGERPPRECGNCGSCAPRDRLSYPDTGISDDAVSVRRGAVKRPFVEKPAVSRPVDEKLFEALRALRSEIAKEQGVPAFVVFADSSLTDMCVKLPRTREGFLDVSGVGNMKLDKFGDRFLAVINGYLENNVVPAAAPVSLQALNGRSADFDRASVEASDEAVTVSMVADRINCRFIPLGRPKTSGRRINEWLAAEGYLEIASVDGVSVKIPTAKGVELGIKTEERTIRGENVKVNLLTRPAQELIIENALKIEAARKARR